MAEQSMPEREAQVARDAMTPDPTWIEPDTSASEAARMMRDRDLGCLPVGENDRLIGMVTDRDIACHVTAEGGDPERVSVRAVMTRGVKWCFDDRSLEEVMLMMAENGIRRLPVINHDKRMVGMITVGDVAGRASGHLGGEGMARICRPG